MSQFQTAIATWTPQQASKYPVSMANEVKIMVSGVIDSVLHVMSRVSGLS